MTATSAAGDIRLDARWVAAAMGGVLTEGDVARQFQGVSIDSRTVAAGDLFIGICGARLDGTAFAPSAIAAGAAGVVVPRGGLSPHPGGDVAVIEVDDTTVALQSLARAVRRAAGTRVVAITGSAGKTTTKEIAADLLATQYRVIRNRGNLNNHIGLPLSLLALRSRPDIAVMELGMNHAGEIRALVNIAEPDVRVWTNVGDAHLGFFASIDGIADAKAEILDGAGPSTLVVANADDDRVVNRLDGYAGRLTTFGLERPADVRATAVADKGLDGTTAHLTTPKGECEIVVPLPGVGNLANVLAAVAVALEFNVPLATIARHVSTLKAASHRGEVVRLPSGVVVMDDSYNANPTATRRALDVLARSRVDGRRVAVLGEMLELEAFAEEMHREVGRAAARAGVDELVAVGGGPAAALAGGAIEAGMPPDQVHHVSTSDDASDVVLALVRPGDVVLVKGSRGIRTERVVERLKAARG